MNDRFGKVKNGLCLATLIASACLIGCGGSASTTPVTTPPVASGAVTPTVTLAVGAPASGVTTATALTVTATVTASTGVPTGTIVLSSGSYGSFPVTLANGVGAISVPAGLLAVGADTLTAAFTSANASAYNNASGTASVTVASANTPLPVVTATSSTCSTMAGSPFRAIPLATGNVLVSVTATNSGLQIFTPSTSASCGYQFLCFNAFPAAALADGSTGLGINLLPNGVAVAASIGADGADFYSLANLQACKAGTPATANQGVVAANEGSFDTVVSPDGKYAFVANEYGVAAGSSLSGNVGVVALQYDANGNVTGTTQVGQFSTGGQYIAGVTLSPDGSRLYVTSEVAGAPVAAGSSNSILTKSTCVQQAGSSPMANGLLTVVDVSKAEANPGASAILATVNAGCSPVRMVETADLSTLWVSARGDNHVLAFSTGMLELNPNNALLGYADTGGTAPVGLRLFDGGKLLAVANSNRFTNNGSGTTNATILSVAVPASASVVQMVQTGAFPREITVGSDGLTLYLTDYNSQQFQVIPTKVQ